MISLYARNEAALSKECHILRKILLHRPLLQGVALTTNFKVNAKTCLLNHIFKSWLPCSWTTAHNSPWQNMFFFFKSF